MKPKLNMQTTLHCPKSRKTDATAGLESPLVSLPTQRYQRVRLFPRALAAPRAKQAITLERIVPQYSLMTRKKRSAVFQNHTPLRPLSAAAGEPAEQDRSQWQPSDLISLKSQASKYQAAEALPRIRPLAARFKSKRQMGLSAAIKFETEEDIRLYLFSANPASKLIKAERGILYFKAPRLEFAPRLPRGYGYKGGVARLALAALIGDNPSKAAPRDLDLVRLPALSAEDQVIASRYMGEDLKHGHGVEIVANIHDYFSTRDISLNEALLFGGQLICTGKAFSDAARHILRPTRHVIDDRGQPQPRIIAKIVRLFAEEAARGRVFTIEGVPPDIEIPPFDLALHLKRALAVDAAAARIYLSECAARGFFRPPQRSRLTLESAISHLSTVLRDPGFFEEPASAQRKRLSFR